MSSYTCFIDRVLDRLMTKITVSGGSLRPSSPVFFCVVLLRQEGRSGCVIYYAISGMRGPRVLATGARGLLLLPLSSER